MEKIEKKIDKIMRIWENYIFKYKFFQNQTIFSDAVKSNYFADIIVYLLDTLPLIFTYLYKKNSEKFHERILYTIGLLQTIYVHQDLIDEMLRIFKLNESSRKDKNPNREIRNEFVGHPINYKNKEDKKKVFSSSIFIKEDTDINTIHYLKYGRENDFSQENIIYSTEEIILRHEKFMNKYLDKILIKLKKLLKNYSKEIEHIKRLNEQDKFIDLINLIDLKYEAFFSRGSIYNKENVLKIYEKKDKHLRYEFAINLFMAELTECLNLEIQNILELLENNNNKKESKNLERNTIEISYDVNKKTNQKYDFGYSLSKLANNKYKTIIELENICYRLGDLKEIFKNNRKITDELDNMLNNINNDFDYFSSYEYLRYLILGKREI